MTSIHYELVKDFSTTQDPIVPSGVRPGQLLGSALFRPQTSIGGILKYPTVEMSAAALLHSIINDHPFYNGNKRTALVSVLVFLDENGLFPEFNEDESFKFILDIARHNIVNIQQVNIADRETIKIAEWISNHCRLIQKGDRSIPFRRLRHILANYNCTLEQVTGGKINISREIGKNGIFSRKKILQIQIIYHDEGRDVSKNTIRKIRKDLQLDELSGKDSQVFYSKGYLGITDFIARYRKTLRRLARF